MHFVLGNKRRRFDLRESPKDVIDIAPPLLSILSIPVNSGLEALGERGFLLPAQVAEFLSVDGVAAIIKGPVLGMRDPIVRFREPKFP